VDNGANVLAQADSGGTPIRRAADKEHADTAGYLVNQTGGDALAQDANRSTRLRDAHDAGDVDTLELLNGRVGGRRS
jgi:hypothetical protein